MPQYLTLATSKLKPGNRSAVEQIADQGSPQIASLPGHLGHGFFLNEEQNEYGGWGV